MERVTLREARARSAPASWVRHAGTVCYTHSQCRDFATQAQAEDRDETWAAAARLRWGSNALDIPIPSFSDLYKEQMVAPFFVFQLFTVGLWMLDDYWQYAVFILAMLLLLEGTVVASVRA